jgi:hypothetical protein
MSAQDVSSDDKRTCSNDRCDLPMGSECHGRRWTDHLTEHVRAKETMDRLEAELKARGMTMFAQIDHAAGAAQVGLSMRAASCGFPTMSRVGSRSAVDWVLNHD